MKILIVDDESVSRKKLERIMMSFGECMAVSSGAEAIKAFKDAWDQWAPFALITLDVSMPEMDGTETLFMIRQMESSKNVPDENRVKIIMVTARYDKSTIATSIQAGCNGYIIKPFDFETVSKEMKKCWTT
jgi:two-component system, chemotaxis family, chemotaxis protein CheY